MADETWACPACGKPVPAECDGRCNTGTTAARVRHAALYVAVAVGTAAFVQVLALLGGAR